MVLSVDEAIAIIEQYSQPLVPENISVTAAHNRIVARDIMSKREHPPAANSAMDGYALRWDDIKDSKPDLPAVLKLSGEIPAGVTSNLHLSHKETIQIMTGATIPAGADTVIPIENTTIQGSKVSILKISPKGSNIRNQGEDIRIDQRVITAGSKIKAAEIGILLTAGHLWVSVSKKPSVSILATGNELIEPGEALLQDKIINSNSYTIAAMVNEAGATAHVLETSKDIKNELRNKIISAQSSDISIIIGGVSVGKYDLVKDTITAIGYDMKFWRVNMRPGYPVAFGVLEKMTAQGKEIKIIFGLPGNPVSAMVSFYQFVRPMILNRLHAKNPYLPLVKAILEEPVKHKQGRKHYARAVTTYQNGSYHVRLTGNQGSGILTSMVLANSLLILPEEGGTFQAGDILPVQLLPI